MHRYANFFQSVCNCGSEIKSGDPVWLGASRTMWAHSSITVQLPTTTVASTEEPKYNISTSANTTLTSQSVQWGADASLECELLPSPPCFNEVYLSHPFHPISCRYGVFDFEYTHQCQGTTEASKKEKLFLISWCPDSAKIKKKMLYSSSFDALKKCLVGVQKYIQVSNI